MTFTNRIIYVQSEKYNGRINNMIGFDPASLGSITLSCCAGASCLVPMGCRHMYEMDMEHFGNQNLSVVVVQCWLLGFVV